MQEHVLAVRSADLRPVRLILGVLNALRSIQLDGITSATGKASQQSKEGQAALWQKANPCLPEALLSCHACICRHSLHLFAPAAYCKTYMCWLFAHAVV